MESTLFDVSTSPWPQVALDSIYKLYPRPENRKAAIKRIGEALDRISKGEIDGAPRTQQEAILYLRERTEAARQEFAGREKRFIPHPTTWFHGSRYLRPKVKEEPPKNLRLCIAILAAYPMTPAEEQIAKDAAPFMPTLRAIEKALDDAGAESNGFEWLMQRTVMFDLAVKEWPVDELRYVPSALNWFARRSYEQPDWYWKRRPYKNYGNYEADREQVRRVLDSRS